MAPYRRQIFIGLIGVLTNLCAAAADVYSSVQPDGTIQFSTQSLDSTSTLFSRGEVATAPSKTPHAKFAGGPSAPSNGAMAAKSTAVSVIPNGLIEHYAQQHAVDLTLVRALIEVESHFQTTALSAKGAYGPMQLMPATAHRYHVTNRSDLAQNIDAGVHYLKDLLVLHHGNEALALASYNAGEGAVKRHGQRIPPYRETMLYVAAVLARAHTARNAMTPIPGEMYARAF
jgi:hypothetical protein